MPLLISAVIAAIIFLLFVIFLFAGIIKKKMGLMLTSVLFFFLFVMTAGYIGFKVIKKTKNALKPRTGMDAYISFWGKPKVNCVEILDFQDQYIPKIDYAIWFHFKTCPEELQRMLSLHKYEASRISTIPLNSSGPLAGGEWFKPESMGDSVLRYEFKKDDYGNSQIVFSNLSRTEAYVQDVQG